MEYFGTFPTIQYTFDAANNDVYAVRNLFVRLKFLDTVLSNTLIYYTYSMQDSDTPESIADKYYGDSKRHWIVLYVNQIMDPYFDLPLKQLDLENNLIAKYGSLPAAQANLDHIEQQTQITTVSYGSSNVTYSNTIVNSPYVYDFSTDQVRSITLPNVANPIIPVSNTSYLTPDGIQVTKVTNLVAINGYDNAVRNNESKRLIKLLDKQYVTQVEAEFKARLSQ